MHSIEIDDADLCCCEYVNIKGEQTHIMACCCDCEAFDEIIDRCVKLEPVGPSEWTECYLTVTDRLRVPWLPGCGRRGGGRGGGAVRVDVDLLLPACLVPASLLLAATHPVAASLLALLLPTAIITYYIKVLRTRSRGGGTRFFLSWLVSSYAALLYVFETVVLSYREVLLVENLLLLLLGALAASHAYVTVTHDAGYVTASTSTHQQTNTTGTATAADSDSSPSSAVTTCSKCNVSYLANSRVSHCNICNRCVRRRDHHCIWLNCCIGEGNHSSFILAIIFAILGSIYAIHLTVCVICTPQMYNIGSSYILYPENCDYAFSDFYTSLAFVCAGYASFLTAMLLLLLWQQVMLISQNLTWVEYRSQQRLSAQRSHSPAEPNRLMPMLRRCCWFDVTSAFNKGVCRNWKYFCSTTNHEKTEQCV